jgi:hypothetical protein
MYVKYSVFYFCYCVLHYVLLSYQPCRYEKNPRFGVDNPDMVSVYKQIEAFSQENVCSCEQNVFYKTSEK